MFNYNPSGYEEQMLITLKELKSLTIPISFYIFITKQILTDIKALPLSK